MPVCKAFPSSIKRISAAPEDGRYSGMFRGLQAVVIPAVSLRNLRLLLYATTRYNPVAVVVGGGATLLPGKETRVSVAPMALNDYGAPRWSCL